LAASSKRDATENVLQLLKNPLSGTNRNRLDNRIMMSGHGERIKRFGVNLARM
jgi:hypothetical protein